MPNEYPLVQTGTTVCALMQPYSTKWWGFGIGWGPYMRRLAQLPDLSGSTAIDVCNATEILSEVAGLGTVLSKSVAIALHDPPDFATAPV